MKVPTFKLKEVEAPWTRWRRQFNDWAARKEAEAAARKANEAQERAEAEAAKARAAAVPVPVGVPSNSEEVAALRDRLAILENAWNAFHQAHEERKEAADAARALLLDKDGLRHETIIRRLGLLETAAMKVEGLEQQVQALVSQAAGFTLRMGASDDQLLELIAKVDKVQADLAGASKATAGKAPAPVSADIDGLRKQLEALKLKIAAVEASDEATRAGLVALQEKQDADEANLNNLRKELEMEVVADPK